MTEALAPIGTVLTRSDASAKVQGCEKYAADYYPQGMLWAGVKRSAYAHAKILRIETSKAVEVTGVAAVLTSGDIRGSNRVGVPEMDQPVLADDKVRCKGDPVVLVLAENKKALELALEKIEIDYEVLPAVFDPREALKPDAPLLYEQRPGKNLLLSGTLERGNGAASLKDCKFVVEGRFKLPWQEHAYLETEAGVAGINSEGILEITASTQTPFRDRNELSHALGLPADKIRVTAPYLGGAFGGKDGITVQGLLGLGAMHSGDRPVKMWTSREESFLSSTKRHPAELHYRLGCTQDGILLAMTCEVVLDTGAYAALGGAVLAMVLEHAAGVYRIPNVFIEGFCVYTNNPVASAFRGFGAPQGLAGIEQMIDLLADEAGIDALKFRLKNAVNRGDTTGSGVLMSNSTGIISCLKKVQRHPLWINRQDWVNNAPAFKKRGVGTAAGMQGTGYGPVILDIANAKTELLPDGRFRIYSGVADMGQGNNPTNIHIAGEILNQAPKDFELLQPDTGSCLPSGSSSASRTTFSFGNALIGACKNLKERILTRACNLMMGAYFENLLLARGKVLDMTSGREISLQAIASSMTEQERISIFSYIAPAAKHPESVNSEIRFLGFPHRIFSFACHLALVEIDELSGEIEVCDYLACTDAGRILNPQIYEQQIHGGIVQGMGYVLWEDFRIHNGDVLCRNLATYILPTAVDIPDLQSLAVETEETGPFGMKGVGEIGINLPYPAISNAVAQALGRRIYEGPLTAERVLKCLNSNPTGGKSED